MKAVKQLQRIYSTAFPTKSELAAYLEQQEQAKARDHRKLQQGPQALRHRRGRRPSLILWTPNGSIVRHELSAEFHRRGAPKAGLLTGLAYRTAGKVELYTGLPGHFPYYKESQFSPVIENESLAKVISEGCSCAEVYARLEAVSAQLASQVNARTGKETITPDRVKPDNQLLDGFMLEADCELPASYQDLLRLAAAFLPRSARAARGIPARFTAGSNPASSTA